MLTPLDDYLCHQTLDEIERVGTSDLRWSERHFITVFDTSGRFLLVHGVGGYPNTKVMDGFVLLSIDNHEQRNLRYSRRLHHDRHDMTVGPCSFEILEPLKRYRIRCGSNEQGFSYDLELETVAAPYERRPQFRPRSNGRITNESCHCTHGYRCSGWIEIDGDRQEVSPDSWYGVKDHSWGRRQSFWDGEFGGQVPQAYGTEGGPYGQGLYPLGGPYIDMWLGAVFDDAFLNFSLRAPVGMESGELHWAWDDPRTMKKLVELERRDVRIDPTSGRLLGFHVAFFDSRGEKLDAEFRVLSTLVERPAGYTGAPSPLATDTRPHVAGDGSFRLGKPMGELYLASDRLELTDPNVFHGMCIQSLQVTMEGRTGYGMVEMAPRELSRLPYVHYFAPRVVTNVQDSVTQGQD